ncbi:hypothetical protein [Mannheimia bovis]|uniref:Uncharacterized protein n=1 Tax=Mannheimia bovis TaxID=2770636 RepID=A0A7H1C0P5_9PAST|nr:hypothetical protein [Mannheimia bovis]QNS14550.1 hypothetical protein ICJ55_07215 [Mannheimia bovis]
MEIKSFSVKNLISNIVILGLFVLANFYLNEQVIKAFIWFFWVMSALSFTAIFAKSSFVISNSRFYQAFCTNLTYSLVLVYFGYPFLATFLFITGFLYAGSRVEKKTKGVSK